MKLTYIAAVVVSVFSLTAYAATEPDWSQGAQIPPGGRPNPYQIDEQELATTVYSGKLHALWYPVEITGVLVPWEAFKRFLDAPSQHPVKRLSRGILRKFTQFKSTDETFAWLGLHTYPDSSSSGIPFPGGKQPDFRMGFTKIRRQHADGFTFSCATCHSSNLFGRKVLGMTNRFPRANEFFVEGKRMAEFMNGRLFRFYTGATPAEIRMFEEMRDNVQSIGTKRPQVVGLDTSLAQVAISLAHRNTDEYATKSKHFENHPRDEKLMFDVADSKPAVWWNVKYKNRWLSDGSVVSGNPIYTNILWNEIGRGIDLAELEQWLEKNDSIIQELTTAVFSTQAPRYTDFFSPTKISVTRAKQGEQIFLQRCARCHGVYEKDWNISLETTQVRYHAKTPVIDVGTDPKRHEGMDSLAKGLNPLSISKKNGIWIEPQKGYVPPPLVGIWARWPYFHNNSAPSLCAVLTRHEKRPETYYAGEAIDPNRDFDQLCNGYPTGSAVPSEWKENKDTFYDTSRDGMSNVGHDEGIFLKNGRELLSLTEKMALIEFLKTL